MLKFGGFAFLTSNQILCKKKKYIHINIISNKLHINFLSSRTNQSKNLFIQWEILTKEINFF